MRFILLPQAVRSMLPSIVSQLVVLLKDSALGLPDPLPRAAVPGPVPGVQRGAGLPADPGRDGGRGDLHHPVPAALGRSRPGSSVAPVGTRPWWPSPWSAPTVRDRRGLSAPRGSASSRTSGRSRSRPGHRSATLGMDLIADDAPPSVVVLHGALERGGLWVLDIDGGACRLPARRRRRRRGARRAGLGRPGPRRPRLGASSSSTSPSGPAPPAAAPSR